MEITSAPDRTLYTDESLSLTCKVSLSPSVDTAVDVTITWTGPQGEVLSTDGRVTLSDVTGSGPYKSILSLYSLGSSDMGSYTCIASVDPDPSTPHIYIVASGNVTDAHDIAIGKNGYRPYTVKYII